MLHLAAEPSPQIDAATRTVLADAVKARGVQPVARELGVPRTAVVGVLAGTCRDGTACLVGQRTRERLSRHDSVPPEAA